MSTDESKTSAGGAADTDMSGNVNAFLREYPLWLFDLPPAGHVIVIPSDTSIADAVAILTKVRCCPRAWRGACGCGVTPWKR